VEPLIGALKHEDSGVRWNATQALGKLGDRRAVAPLIQALGDASGRVRNGVIWALGELRDRRAADALLDALKREDVVGVAQALGKLGDLRAVPYLLWRFEHPAEASPGWDPIIVRVATVKALGALHAVEAIPFLLDLFLRYGQQIRDAVAAVLVQMGPPVFRQLYYLLKGKNRRLRVMAVKALKELPDLNDAPADLADRLVQEYRARQSQSKPTPPPG
jgi:HEAT repeat protein